MRLSSGVGDHSLVTDEVWAVIGPLFPAWKGNGRPVADCRLVVEETAWKFRTGAPWRDLPERFGNWNTVFKNFDRWAKDGTWTRVLEHVQTRAETLGDLDWVASIDPRLCVSTSMGRHFPVTQGEPSNYMKLGLERPDHAIGRSRGGLTSKFHMATDGKGRMLSAVLTTGNINDTTMMRPHWDRSGFHARDGADPAPVRTGSWQTRATPPGPTATGWPIGASRPPSRRSPTRRPTGNGRAHSADGRRRSTARLTRVATSRNADSTASRTGAASPRDRTRLHATSWPPFSSRQRSHG